VTAGVTAPAGFSAAGVAAGLKSSGAVDVALVVNTGPIAAAAAVFTTNRIEAAPVTWSRQVTADGEVRAVVLNSGGANACTGAPGFQDTHATAEHLASLLGLGAGDVAVCSTGLIGDRLPMDKLLAGVDAAAAALATHGGSLAAQAIMTTDSVSKQAAVTGGGFTVGGMAKGAGMLAPGLATMLVVVTTDAVADAATLDAVLRDATRVSFDRIDSDGCMSTNDTVLLLASGSSGTTPSMDALQAAVTEVCSSLARQLIGDAEGASHDIRIDIVNAASEADGLDAARSIARSNLFKCAVFGEDPNWGRVLSAIGTTQAAFEPQEVDVAINGVKVCIGGAIGEDRTGVDMKPREVTVHVDLHAGNESVTVWTNDLTVAYVHENSAYST
jgi:glutamate N-acetyltransferase/amino-acid N-acetyltransferase